MSDLIDDFKELKAKSKGDVEKSLAYSLVMLVSYLGNITEFKNSELLAFSLFESEDEILYDMLRGLIRERKSVKRKFSSEIREVVKDVCKAIGLEYSMKKISRFRMFFNRNQNDLF